MTKETLLDVRKIIRFGNSAAVVVDEKWLKENGGKVGDKVLMRIELLKNAKDLKIVKK